MQYPKSWVSIPTCCLQFNSTGVIPKGGGVLCLNAHMNRNMSCQFYKTTFFALCFPTMQVGEGQGDNLFSSVAASNLRADGRQN